MRPARSLLRKAGFTMIEVLTVLMVVSVVVRIGIPNYQNVLSRAEAVRAAGDFRVVREALEHYGSEHNGWPRDFGPGQVPPELAPYLQEGFSFNRGHYRLDLQNWSLPDGLPSQPDTRTMLGLSVVTDDTALGAALNELMGPEFPHFAVGGTYTFILDTR